jgi:CRISPR-associated protein (TIGR03984 family)
MSYAELCKPEALAEGTDPIQWLVGQAKTDMTLLLAHTDEGVVWGKVDNGQLRLAGDAFSEVQVKLQTATLQQARLFGPAGEVFVWRESETRFRARRIVDGITPPADTLEDHQWLWGTPVGGTDADGHFALLQKDGFMLLRDGRQGLLHAPPVGHLELKPDDRVLLTIRHYLAVHQDTGLAYIADSRLMDLRRV